MTTAHALRTRTLMMLTVPGLMAALAACSDSTPAVPDDQPPVVVDLASDSHGAIDGEIYKVTCLLGPDGSPVSSPTCPVVQWEGFEYWALAFHDNRSSMAMHVFDDTGALMRVTEYTGARYVYRAEIDATAETVTFWGQSDNSVTLTWDDLRSIR